MYISSNQNETIKKIRKIRDDAGFRKETNLFLAEGVTLVNEIAPCLVDSIYIDENKYDTVCNKVNKDLINSLYGDKIYKIKSTVFENVVDTKNSQGVCALVNKKNIELGEFLKNCNNTNKCRIIILENISDPGNVGTILRSSLAFSMSGVIIDSKSADIYSPKTVRSSMGAIFKQNIYVSSNLLNDINLLKKEEIKIWTTSPNDEHSKDCKDINYNDYKKLALVFGNEAHGISMEMMNVSDEIVKMEMNAQIDSLNVAICASIFMYLIK